MLQRAKRRWRELRDDPPGERFQRRYRRAHEDGESPFRRWALIGAGVAVLAAGLFFLPAPGPGTVILALGAALIARESLAAARALDRLEMRSRGVLAWGRSVYERASPAGRVAMVAAALLLLGGAAYGAYRWLFGA